MPISTYGISRGRTQMKLGIIGLTGSGKKSIFEALTRHIGPLGLRNDDRIGTINVPDHRVDVLRDMYQPAKTTYAKVEYFLPAQTSIKRDHSIWNSVRDCDALIHVIQNFDGFTSTGLNPFKAFKELEEDMILSDLGVCEKRLERIDLDKKRGKTVNPEEVSLLNDCMSVLENEDPLRKHDHLAGAHALKGFAFISAKPLLVLYNNGDDDDTMPDEEKITASSAGCMVIKGKIEHEIAQMSDEEAKEFMTEFDISSSAMDRVIQKSYEILGLISFFTVGKDEVKAWTIRRQTQALDAAGIIHSDIKKGFIRAEVLSYDDLLSAGSQQEAKKRGTARLEGKTYIVKDGDIINFRFNI